MEALGFADDGQPRNASLFVRSGAEESSEVSFGVGGRGLVARPLFESSLRDGCEPGEWSLVYGMLKAPGASVTATTPAGAVQLATVQVPAGLHVGGTLLAYGSFAGVPLS